MEGRERLEDDNREGKPISARTPELIEKVRNLIAKDRNASLKMMEEALNVSRETIQTIFHENLGKTKVYAKFVPHTLTDDVNFWHGMKSVCRIIRHIHLICPGAISLCSQN